MVTRAQQELLKRVCQGSDTGSFEQLCSQYLLLKHVATSLERHDHLDALQSQFGVFMLVKIANEIPQTLQRRLEAHHGQVILQALRTTNEELSQRLRTLKQLKPNSFSQVEIAEVDRMRQQLEERSQDQLSFVWVHCLDDQNGSQSQSDLQGLQGLQEHFSLLSFNDDKEFVKPEDLDSFTLADMIRCASPYLVFIPRRPETILMSASSLYPVVCCLQDHSQLCFEPSAESSSRQSWRHPICCKRDTSLVEVVNLMNLEQAFSSKRSLEVTTIDRILSDEGKVINLRDLPSFFACSAGLLEQMKLMLEHSESKSNLLAFATRVAETVSAPSEELDDRASQLGQALSADAIDSEKQTQSIKAIVGCFRVFLSLDTVELVQAMLVLPFELMRIKAMKEIQYQEAYLAELSFWFYHLRDCAESLKNAQSTKGAIAQLQAQIAHLQQLLPSPEIQVLLTGLLEFVSNLCDGVTTLESCLLGRKSMRASTSKLLSTCQMIQHLVFRGLDQYFTRFNHLIESLLASCLGMAIGVRSLLAEQLKSRTDHAEVQDRVVSLKSQRDYLRETTIFAK